jgi:hypothetical protein
VLATVKGINPRLADSLSHARPLWMRPGEVAVAFVGAQAGFHRMQSERPASKGEIDRALVAHFARPTSLKVEKDVPADEVAPPSPAEELAAHRSSREQRLTRAAKEHPAVLAALKVLGGTLQEVRVRDEIPRPAEEPELEGEA